MGRPRLPEAKKMRSVKVGLAPRSTERILKLLARVKGQAGQEILRGIVVPALERMYQVEVDKGHALPPFALVEGMTEEAFRKLLGSPLKATGRRRVVKQREAAHAH